ncbi:MAG: hypothetical protein RL885_19120, partial [Planctomycetota bacterium]
MDISQHGLVIEAEAEDCTVEVVLNGIPLGLAGLGEQPKFHCPIHEYLLDGPNELGLLINPGDSPANWRRPSRKRRPAWYAQPPESPLSRSFSGKGAPPGPPADGSDPVEPPADEDPDWGLEHVVWSVRGLAALPSMNARAAIMKYPVDAVVGDGSGVPLVKLHWRAYDEFRSLREEEQPFPKWVSRSEDLGPMFGPVHWTTLDPITLDEETVQSLKDFVLKIRDHIEKGEAAPVLDLSKEKYLEVAKAYGLDREERAAMFEVLLLREIEDRGRLTLLDVIADLQDEVLQGQ